MAGEARIAILGAGAIGCLIAARMAPRTPGLVLVGRRPEPLAVINEKGIEITGGPPAPARVAAMTAAAAAETGPFEVVFLAVKSGDTEGAMETAVALLTPDGVVVSMQNGLNEDRIARFVGPTRALGAVFVMGTEHPEPNVVRALDPTPALSVGALDPDGAAQAVARVAGLLTSCGEVTITRDLWGQRWAKLALNCIGNPVLALGGLNARELFCDRRGQVIARAVVGELLAVANAEGVEVAPIGGLETRAWVDPSDEGIATVHATVDAFGVARGDNRSSMSQDIDAGRPTEIDYLNGEVCARGARAGVPTPINDRIVAMVHDLEAGRRTPDPNVLDDLAARAEAGTA